jgi:hypothetical protein
MKILDAKYWRAKDPKLDTALRVFEGQWHR